MPVTLLWLTLVSARADDTVIFQGDARVAVSLVGRDADIPAGQVRTVPLTSPAQPRLVGGLVGLPCAAPQPPEALSDALREAEDHAVTGEEAAGRAALRRAFDALTCLSAPVRAVEAARLHDLASAYAMRFDADRDGAVRQAAQALAFDPQTPFQYQADPGILDEARARHAAAPRSVLLLPPGLAAYDVLVDGRPATSATVLLVPGTHVVQHLVEPLRTLAVQVPEVPVRGALTLPEDALATADLDDPHARAWLALAVADREPGAAMPWVVTQGRVWQVDTDTGAWLRYDRRPPKAVRPTLLALTSAGLAAGLGTTFGLGLRWDALERCGTVAAAEAPAACQPFVDATTGLVTQVDDWGAARTTATALTLAGAGLAVVSGSLLGLVASRARAPHAVRLAVAPGLDGASVRLDITPAAP